MSAPSNITVECEFTPGVWTDISDYVESLDPDRGRSFELDDIQAGVCNVTLDNSDGRFTPGLARINSDTIPAATNLYTNPSFEAAAAGVAPSSGNTTVSVSTTQALVGTKSAKMVSTVSGTDQFCITTVGIPCTPSTTYRIEAWVYVESITGAPVSNRALMVVRADNTVAYATDVSMTTSHPVGVWTKKTLTFTTNATDATFKVRFYSPQGTVYWDKVMIVDPSYPLGYFDGDTPGAVWTGTPHASTSFWAAGQPAPYYPNVVPRKQVRVTATGSTAHPIFQGRVEKWPVKVSLGTSEVEVPVVDDFSRMAGVSLKPMVHQMMMSVFKPDHYWPCNEAAGATSVANVVNSKYPGALQTAKAGGVYTPGGLALTKVGEGGSGSSISLAGNTASNTGAGIEALTQGGSGTFGATGFSFAMLANASNWTSGSRGVFSIFTDDGRLVLTIYIDSLITIRDWTGAATNISTTLANNIPTVIGGTIRFGASNATFLDLYLGGDATGGKVTQYLGTIQGSYPAGTNVGAVYFGNRVAGRFGYDTGMNVTVSNCAVWLNGAPPAGPADWPNPFIMLDAAAGGEPWPGAAVGSVLSVLFSAGLGSSTYTTLGAADTRLLKWPDWAEGDNALATALSYASEASGIIVMGPDGVPKFVTHDYLSSATSAVTFKDSTGTSVEEGLEFDVDFDHVANIVTVDNYLGSSPVLRDAASRTTYGDTTADLTSHFVSDTDATERGNWYIHQYAQPVIRLGEVQVRASANAVSFDTLASLDIGSRITIAELPGQAPFPSGEFIIERIKHELTVDGETYDWRTTFDLSPASLWDVWILEDPVKGILESPGMVLSL